MQVKSDLISFRFTLEVVIHRSAIKYIMSIVQASAVDIHFSDGSLQKCHSIIQCLGTKLLSLCFRFRISK